MKKLFAVLLIVVLSLSLFACGGTPIEKADKYIKKLDDAFEDDCSWRAKVERTAGEQEYMVYVTLPYYSDSISSSDSVQNSQHGDVIGNILEHELKQEVEKIAQKAYSKLSRILKKEESIDGILIMFEYADKRAYRYYYEDGELKDFYDFLK